jgi:excisionase family DNA binding protein
MPRRFQFGMRENPASDRRHGSRFALGSVTKENCITDNSPISSGVPLGPAQAGNALAFPNAASPHAAAGGEESTITASDTASAPLPTHIEVPSEFEPLIDSSEAARLLGNVHVKTLQRYARHGNLPGYQIGGHWYFRASELDSWLRSRLNSSSHPCCLQEKSDGA